jgi:biotin carboxyl carrier protein
VQFEIEVGSRLRKVSVHRKDGAFLVTVDGTAHLVDAARIDGSTLSLLVREGADGAPTRSVEASVVAQALPGAYDVHVAGRLIPLQVRAGSGLGRRRDGAGPGGSGPQRVTAPMPGKVVRVLVKPGDEVTPRQGLVVVEAMKMENELRAAREGRVKTVAVTEGQSVESGALLVVVE